MLQLPDPAQALTALQIDILQQGHAVYSPHLCQCDRQSWMGEALRVCRHLQSLQRLPRPSFTGVQENEFEEGGMSACLASSVCRHMSHKIGVLMRSAHTRHR